MVLIQFFFSLNGYFIKVWEFSQPNYFPLAEKEKKLYLSQKHKHGNCFSQVLNYKNPISFLKTKRDAILAW